MGVLSTNDKYYMQRLLQEQVERSLNARLNPTPLTDEETLLSVLNCHANYRLYNRPRFDADRIRVSGGKSGLGKLLC